MNSNRHATKSKKGGNPNLFHAEAATVSIEDAGYGYQVPSMLAAGAEAQHVAMLSAMTSLALSFLYIKVLSLRKKIGSTKKAVFLFCFIDALTWLPLIIVMLCLQAIDPVFLIVLWILNMVPGSLLIPLRDGWLASTVPITSMGRHLGLRSAISAAAYLGAFFLMGRTLDNMGTTSFKGFAIVSCISLVAALGSLLIYSLTRNSNEPDNEQSQLSIAHFLQETRTQWLGKFVIYISSLHFAVALCSSLYAVYLIQDLGLSNMMFAVVLSSEYLAMIVAGMLWGRASDRVGSMPILRKISYLMPIVPVLWLLSTNVIYLILVQMLSGTLWAGFNVCSRNLLYSSATPEKRSSYIVYQQSLVTLTRGLGALAGVGLLGVVTPLIAHPILALFLISGILRFGIIISFVPGIKDGLETTASSNSFLQPQNTALRPSFERSQAKSNLFYRHNDWNNYARTYAPHLLITSSSAETQPGLYFRPNDWPAFLQQHAHQHYAPALPTATEQAQSSLYFRQEDWQSFIQQHTPQPTATTLQTDAEQMHLARHTHNSLDLLNTHFPQPNTDALQVETKHSQPGLNLRPHEWHSFVHKHILKPKTRSHAGESPAVVEQPGLYYRPHDWSAFVQPYAIRPGHFIPQYDKLQADPHAACTSYDVPAFLRQQPIKSAAFPKKAEAQNSQAGLYFRPHDWQRFVNHYASQYLPEVQAGIGEVKPAMCLSSPDLPAFLRQHLPQPAKTTVKMQIPQTDSGLYFRRNEWSSFLQKHTPQIFPAAWYSQLRSRACSAAIPAPIKYHRSEPQDAKPHTETFQVKKGLYFRRHDWQAFLRQYQYSPQTATAGMDTQKAQSGIDLRNMHWPAYLR